MLQRQHGKHSKKAGAVKVARYQQLAYETEKLIADGILRPGDRLPSVRQTCRTYAISPVTVTQAYYLLESRGLIEARPKSGYFVRPRLGQRLDEPQMSHPRSQSTALQVSDFIFQILNSVKDPAVVPLGSSFPSPFLFPLDKLGRFLGHSARNSNPLSTVTDLPPGNEELRRQIALRYLAHGASVSPQEIVVTSGAMEGLNLCLQALTQPGDLVAIESPTFYAGLQASERLAHLGNVIDRDHHLALDRPGELGHPVVLLEPKAHAVAFRAPVRRVTVEQGVLTIIAANAVSPWKVLDEDLLQAQMSR